MKYIGITKKVCTFSQEELYQKLASQYFQSALAVFVIGTYAYISIIVS